MSADPTAADVMARPQDDLPTRQAYLMLARGLRRLGHQTCGLWPASADMEFEDVPRCLAMSLASLGGTVGVVARPGLWWDDADRNELSITALGEGVDTLVPARNRIARLGTAIEQTLDAVRERYSCTLLDLSGLDAIGAQEVALVPGVGMVLFVPSGHLREHALVRLRRRFPAERMIGAVLVDKEPTKPSVSV